MLSAWASSVLGTTFVINNRILKQNGYTFHVLNSFLVDFLDGFQRIWEPSFVIFICKNSHFWPNMCLRYRFPFGSVWARKKGTRNILGTCVQDACKKILKRNPRRRFLDGFQRIWESSFVVFVCKNSFFWRNMCLRYTFPFGSVWDRKKGTRPHRSFDQICV